MSGAIADDVMNVAVSIEGDIPSRITGANRVFIRSVIARAIMNERNRCAGIAAPLPMETDDSDYEKQSHDIRSHIYDQIVRRQEY